MSTDDGHLVANAPVIVPMATPFRNLLPREPRPGDYIVVRTGGLAARLIRLVTRSRFNHAAIYIGNGQVIEATPRHGVIVASLTEYAGDLMLSNSDEPTMSEQRAAVVDFARYLVGERYSFESDAVDLLARLGIHWRVLGRLAGVRKALMCSQLVAICGVHPGLPAWLCGKAAAGEVVPGDLAARIERNQWT
jgi:hypothetical protein